MHTYRGEVVLLRTEHPGGSSHGVFRREVLSVPVPDPTVNLRAGA